MGGDEFLHLGAELIDQEGAAVADGAARRGADLLPDARRKGRERQARQDEVGMIETEFRDDLLDIRGRAVDRDEPVVVDFPVEIVDEIRVGVDRDLPRVLAQLFEDRAGEGADARAIFDEQPGGRPVDRL